MPFQSEKQRRYLWANEPEIARDWADTYGSRIKKNSGGISQLVKSGPGRPGYAGEYDLGWDEGGDTPMPGGGHGSGHVAATYGGTNVNPTNEFEGTGTSIGGEWQPPTYDVSGPYKDDDEKKGKVKRQEAITQDFIKSKGNYPAWAPGWAQALGNFNREPNRKFFVNKVLRAGKLPGVNYSNLSDPNFDLEAAYQSYMSDRMSGKTDAYGNPTGGWRKEGDTWIQSDPDDQGVPGVTQVASTPVVEEVEEEVSPFQQSLIANATGTGLPFPYWVGGGATQAQIDHMNQYGQYAGGTYAAEGGRIPAAFGGIMDSSTGRRAYGLGSFFKSIGKAAKKIIKSPIGKAALLGLGGYWLGGGQALGGAKMFGTKFGQNFAFDNLMKRKGMSLLTKGGEGAAWDPWKVGIAGLSALPFFMGGKDDDDDGFDYEGAKNAYRDELMRIKAGAMAGSLNPNEFNYLGVKDGGRIGLEGGGDPMLVEEYEKYVFELKEIKPWAIPMTFEQFKEQVRAGQAEGGRTGHYKGGQSIPSDFTLEDATISTTQDKLGGITDVMKQADLFRSGDVGQFYAAQGGRSGYKDAGGVRMASAVGDESDDIAMELYGKPVKDLSPAELEDFQEHLDKLRTKFMAQGGRSGYGAGGKAGRPPINLIKGNDQPVAQAPAPMSPNQNKPMNQPMNPMMNSPMMNRPMMNPMMARGNPMGGRRMAEEGGLMDLGGMEKDYRNDGGFVPLGGEEKADDVPARLSKNEFVFTADAVRGAGGGDIDKGAEIMENVMENLENGGNISEESQGLEGARDMFATSQRLEGVI